jgi:hypothetical protein
MKKQVVVECVLVRSVDVFVEVFVIEVVKEELFVRVVVVATVVCEF